MPGPAVLMSFDPAPVAALREIAPGLPRGIVAERHYEDSEWYDLDDSQKRSLAFLHPRAAHAAAFRRLSREGPALAWPVDCTQHLRPAAARLDGAQRRGPGPRQTLGRPDDFRGLSGRKLIKVDERANLQTSASCRPSPTSRRPRGTPAPILNRRLKFARTTRSSRTRFCTRWKPPARPPRAPAGSRSISSPRSASAVVGVVPCYLKSHSRGEYVFDAGWAEAYERAGGSYYPKLQVSVPFTPATGRRLLVAPGETADPIREALAKGLIELSRMRDASSVHVTFAPEDRMGPARPRTASSSATTSNSTGRTAATRRSTISSARSPRANARRSGASAPARWRTASRWSG